MGRPLTVRRAPANAPKTDPDLARMISAVSGFFFCGMIEDVEQNASSSSTNFTNDVLQITSSSQSRLTLVIRIEMSASVSRAKSRVATASMVFVTSPSKPSRVAVNSRLMQTLRHQADTCSPVRKYPAAGQSPGRMPVHRQACGGQVLQAGHAAGG